MSSVCHGGRQLPGASRAICGGLSLALVLLTIGTAGAICVDPAGDVNANGETSVVDVQCSALTILWAMGALGNPAPLCLNGSPSRTDLDCDGQLIVTDAMMLITLALGLPLNPVIDADGNQCVDGCESLRLGEPIVRPVSFQGRSTGNGIVVEAMGTWSGMVGASSGGDVDIEPKKFSTGELPTSQTP